MRDLRWELQSGGDDPDNIQVVPVADLRRHMTDGGPCWCNPVFERYTSGAVIVIHTAVDGRRTQERQPLSLGN